MQIGQEIEFDDTAVGILALVSMYQVMKLLAYSVFIAIVGALIGLLGEQGSLDRETANTLLLLFTVLSYTVLIVFLAIRGKRDFIKQLALAHAAEDDSNQSESYHAPMAFTETQLEITVIAAAVIALLCGLLMGMEALALRVLLGIIEAFAFLFMLTFVTIRFLTARNVRPRALACLVLTGISLWYLIISS